MNRIASGLKRKVGPLPLWAWASIAGVGLGAFIYLRRDNTPAATTSDAAPPADDSGEVGSGGGLGGLGSGGGTLPPDAAGNNDHQDTGNAGYPDFATELADIASVIGNLQQVGFLGDAPASDSTPAVNDGNGTTLGTTAHPAATKPGAKINTQAGNPRKGLEYKTVTLADGRTAHVYGTGKPSTGGHTVVLPGTTKVADTPHIAPVTHSPQTQVNTDPGNPRKGETYQNVIKGNGFYHRYGTPGHYTDVYIRPATHHV